jgi:hypothetical protein
MLRRNISFADAIKFLSNPQFTLPQRSEIRSDGAGLSEEQRNRLQVQEMGVNVAVYRA